MISTELAHITANPIHSPNGIVGGCVAPLSLFIPRPRGPIVRPSYESANLEIQRRHYWFKTPAVPLARCLLLPPIDRWLVQSTFFCTNSISTAQSKLNFREKSGIYSEGSASYWEPCFSTSIVLQRLANVPSCCGWPSTKCVLCAKFLRKTWHIQ